MRYIYSILVGLALMVACVKDNAYDVNLEMEYFKAAEVTGLYGAYGAEVELDGNTEQIYQRAEGAELRIIGDEGAVCLTLIFSEPPTESSEDITLTITLPSSDEDVVLTVSCINSSDDLLWLWDTKLNEGVIVPVW